LHGLVVGSQAFDRQVGARRWRSDQDFLGFLHARQQRHFAVVVIINTDAQIDFLWVLVGVKGFGIPRIGSRGAMSMALNKLGFVMIRLDSIGSGSQQRCIDSALKINTSGRWQAIILTKV
jgi:hypothetical protein